MFRSRIFVPTLVVTVLSLGWICAGAIDAHAMWGCGWGRTFSESPTEKERGKSRATTYAVRRQVHCYLEARNALSNSLQGNAETLNLPIPDQKKEVLAFRLEEINRIDILASFLSMVKDYYPKLKRLEIHLSNSLDFAYFHDTLYRRAGPEISRRVSDIGTSLGIEIVLKEPIETLSIGSTAESTRAIDYSPSTRAPDFKNTENAARLVRTQTETKSPASSFRHPQGPMYTALDYNSMQELFTVARVNHATRTMIENYRQNRKRFLAAPKNIAGLPNWRDTMVGVRSILNRFPLQKQNSKWVVKEDLAREEFRFSAYEILPFEVALMEMSFPKLKTLALYSIRGLSEETLAVLKTWGTLKTLYIHTPPTDLNDLKSLGHLDRLIIGAKPTEPQMVAQLIANLKDSKPADKAHPTELQIFDPDHFEKGSELNYCQLANGVNFENDLGNARKTELESLPKASYQTFDTIASYLSDQSVLVSDSPGFVGIYDQEFEIPDYN